MFYSTIGVIGQSDNDFLKRLGNKGTINDMEFRNYSKDDNVITFCAPKSDKIIPLLQTMGIVDVPIVVFDEPNSFLGEAVLAVEAMGFKNGILCLSDSFDKKMFENIVESSNLSNFKILSMDQQDVKDFIFSKSFRDMVNLPEGPTKIPVDNYFTVRSVGTVILGLIRRGNLGVYTKLMLYPEQREVLVKSIQSQDKDVRNATTLQRIGLSLKGVKSDELKRGNIVAEKDSLKVVKEISIDLRRNNVVKEDIKAGNSYFLSIGLQAAVGRVLSFEGSRLVMELEREVAIDDSDSVLVALTTPKPPRIVGGGKIIE